ncbi:hypothetical protein EC968_004797 [Mortierella alpina]|nr:hypothetical protein EC968_004797 [Mortierella alpina]
MTPVSAAPVPVHAPELRSDAESMSPVKINSDLQKRAPAQGGHIPGTGTGIGNDFNKNDPFGRKK